MRVSLVPAIVGVAMVATVALPALAANPHVEGAVYRERAVGGERLIEPASQLRSGDKVVLLVRWRVADDRDGFVVTTPVPTTLAYQRGSTDAVEVSVDGGRSWGRLDALKARPDQVTHLRWRIGARAASQGAGSFAYSALVR